MRAKAELWELTAAHVRQSMEVQWLLLRQVGCGVMLFSVANLCLLQGAVS